MHETGDESKVSEIGVSGPSDVEYIHLAWEIPLWYIYIDVNKHLDLYSWQPHGQDGEGVTSSF